MGSPEITLWEWRCWFRVGGIFMLLLMMPANDFGWGRFGSKFCCQNSEKYKRSIDPEFIDCNDHLLENWPDV
jgi:hypothetical protein